MCIASSPSQYAMKPRIHGDRNRKTDNISLPCLAKDTSLFTTYYSHIRYCNALFIPMTSLLLPQPPSLSLSLQLSVSLNEIVHVQTIFSNQYIICCEAQKLMLYCLHVSFPRINLPVLQPLCSFVNIQQTHYRPLFFQYSCKTHNLAAIWV